MQAFFPLPPSPRKRSRKSLEAAQNRLFLSVSPGRHWPMEPCSGRSALHLGGGRGRQRRLQFRFTSSSEQMRVWLQEAVGGGARVESEGGKERGFGVLLFAREWCFSFFCFRFFIFFQKPLRLLSREKNRKNASSFLLAHVPQRLKQACFPSLLAAKSTRQLFQVCVSTRSTVKKPLCSLSRQRPRLRRRRLRLRRCRLPATVQAPPLRSA